MHYHLRTRAGRRRQRRRAGGSRSGSVGADGVDLGRLVRAGSVESDGEGKSVAPLVPHYRVRERSSVCRRRGARCTVRVHTQAGKWVCL